MSNPVLNRANATQTTGMSPPAAAPASSGIAVMLDKHLTTLVSCVHNVVYVILLAVFVEMGMLCPMPMPYCQDRVSCGQLEGTLLQHVVQRAGVWHDDGIQGHTQSPAALQKRQAPQGQQEGR
jgi:hypothetical protein